MDLAKQLVALLPPGAEIAKPGFINVRLKAQTKLSVIAQALKEARPSAVSPQRIRRDPG